MSNVKQYALRLYNEWGGYSPQMVDPQTLPNPDDRAKYVEASDYDALAADNQRLREALEGTVTALEYLGTRPDALVAPYAWDKSNALVKLIDARAALAGSKGGE